MTVKELLSKTSYSVVYRFLKKYSPYTNGIEYEILSHRKKIRIKNALKRRYFEFYNELKNTKEIKNDENIVVISKLFSEVDGYKNGFYYSPFFVKKSEVIDKKNKGDITLWNGKEETRIEHYSMDALEPNEVLGYSICPNSLKLNYNLLVAIIMIEITRFGLTKERRKQNIDSLLRELDEAMEDIKNGRTYTMEEMEEEFDKWREELMGRKETEEEKKNRKQKEKEISERSQKINSENHLIVINDVKSIN